MVDKAVVEETAQAAVSSVKAANVLAHVKDNNVSYLLASLIAYQLGLLDQLITYGTGMC